MPIYVEHPALSERVLDEAGLIDHPDLLLSMEQIFYDYKSEVHRSQEMAGIAQRATARRR